MDKIVIREAIPEDFNSILKIVDLLPEWFNKDARIRSIPIDIKFHKCFLAEINLVIVGFITLFVAEGRLNIGWFGVVPDKHNIGIGSALLGEAEKYGRRMGLDEITTYTLGDSVEYAPYEKTRIFYFKKGFTVFQRSQTDNPGCPEEIKIKKSI